MRYRFRLRPQPPSFTPARSQINNDSSALDLSLQQMGEKVKEKKKKKRWKFFEENSITFLRVL